MKIGYPCINLSIGCRSNRTFRLKSYSEERLVSTVAENLSCLLQILRFNVEHGLFFFRITSDLVPFASHPICRLNWHRYFESEFKEVGDFVHTHGIRISMHPDQFTLINSPEIEIYERSLRELLYHAQVLDAMGLDDTAKIQLHVGGLYGDKRKSSERFGERYRRLPEAVRRRLVIENDDKMYSLQDCLGISTETGVPVLFDLFHHRTKGSGESVAEALDALSQTWGGAHGVPMVDYSSQRAGERRGTHTETIDAAHFRDFLEASKPYDFDVMLEVKDKERSALRAVDIARGDERFSAAAGLR